MVHIPQADCLPDAIDDRNADHPAVGGLVQNGFWFIATPARVAAVWL